MSGSRLQSRTLSFGGTIVRVEFTPGRPARLVRFLFDRVPQARRRTGVTTLRLTDHAGRFVVALDGEVRVEDAMPGVAASWLLHLTCRQLAFTHTRGLLLHAAAVEAHGRALVLAGASGSGKTTLTAFLTGRGFGYLTDELVHVPLSALRVDGLAAPLKLKPGGMAALDGRLPFPPSRRLVGREDALLRPRVMRRAPHGRPVAALLFPRFRRGAAFALRPVTPGRAALRLMAGVLNAERLADHGFSQVTRLAAQAPAYQLTWGSLDQIEAHLDRLRALARERHTT